MGFQGSGSVGGSAESNGVGESVEGPAGERRDGQFLWG